MTKNTALDQERSKDPFLMYTSFEASLLLTRDLVYAACQRDKLVPVGEARPDPDEMAAVASVPSSAPGPRLAIPITFSTPTCLFGIQVEDKVHVD